MRRLLITGSRTWDNEPAAREALIAAFTNMGGGVVLVHGNAVGADAMCRDIWRAAGLPDEPHRPQWMVNGVYDPRAGFERNAKMVALGADAALAFDLPCSDPKCRRTETHVSHGTEHCINLIEHARIPLWRWSLLPH